MSDTLDMLFFGKLDPYDQETVDVDQIKRVERDMNSYEKKLRATFTPDQIAIFETYLDHQADLFAVRESAAFKKGFGLGMQLTMEGMGIDKRDV